VIPLSVIPLSVIPLSSAYRSTIIAMLKCYNTRLIFAQNYGDIIDPNE